MKAIDLFCGCGGMSAGLMNAGIDVVSAYDNWSIAVDTYNRNLPPHAQVLDLSDSECVITEINKHDVDIIVGGPPCQDFSVAGNMVEGARANLTINFGEIIAAHRPPYFLMENVPRTRRHGAAYKTTKSMLEGVGYTISEIVLDASFCGVPQERKRFFVFGSLVDYMAEAFLTSLKSRLSSHRMTVKEYLGDEIDIEFYYRKTRDRSRKAIYSVYEPAPTMICSVGSMPSDYTRNHLDAADPSEVQELLPYFRGRIQTFPADWDWGSSNGKTNTNKLIGNAVPVNMATFVARGVLDASESQPPLTLWAHH